MKRRRNHPLGRQKANSFTLGEAIQLYLERINARDRMQEGLAGANWVEILGPQVAQHVEAVWRRDGVWYFRTPNPAWKHELMFARESMRQAINTYAHGEICKEVRIV